MERMRFNEKWRGWISECLRTTSISILVNGSPTKTFQMERGLRQGDPLSPFLFLLATEGFHVMMVKSIQLKLFDEYKVGKDEVKVSHIQYADDTIIVGKKSWKNIWAIKANLQLFELISRLKVNFHKSSLIRVYIHRAWLEEADERWRFLNEKSSLWVRILESKYGGFGQEAGRVDRLKSLWWRDLQSVDIGEDGFKGQWFEENVAIGDGAHTRFLGDPWVEVRILKKVYPELYRLALDKKVSVRELFRREGEECVWID
ncbi:uncharacterized protein LOC131649585 [Vicia villosa]|uniref:uncharacterized protein LOC131649585 n=1 Tax=Vicia villosa TaxID=3911 RepID=UPI00273C44CC|nr:uncharacterized protein LOC131649585 [Vicia villosa]